jgi:TonB family protein
MISDAIGSRCYYYVSDRMDMLTAGTVEVRFIINATGKVEKVQVIRNSSNEIFAATSVRSITEAEIPPIPPDVAKTLEGGRIETEFSFTIMSN